MDVNSYSKLEVSPKISDVPVSCSPNIPIRAPLTVDSDTDSNASIRTRSDAYSSGYSGFESDGELDCETASERLFVSVPDRGSLDEEFHNSRSVGTDPDDEFVIESGRVEKVEVSRSFGSGLNGFRTLGSGNDEEIVVGSTRVEKFGISRPFLTDPNGFRRSRSFSNVSVGGSSRVEKFELSRPFVTDPNGFRPTRSYSNVNLGGNSQTGNFAVIRPSVRYPVEEEKTVAESGRVEEFVSNIALDESAVTDSEEHFLSPRLRMPIAKLSHDSEGDSMGSDFEDDQFPCRAYIPDSVSADNMIVAPTVRLDDGGDEEDELQSSGEDVVGVSGSDENKSNSVMIPLSTELNEDNGFDLNGGIAKSRVASEEDNLLEDLKLDEHQEQLEEELKGLEQQSETIEKHVVEFTPGSMDFQELVVEIAEDQINSNHGDVVIVNDNNVIRDVDLNEEFVDCPGDDDEKMVCEVDHRNDVLGLTDSVIDDDVDRVKDPDEACNAVVTEFVDWPGDHDEKMLCEVDQRNDVLDLADSVIANDVDGVMEPDEGYNAGVTACCSFEDSGLAYNITDNIEFPVSCEEYSLLEHLQLEKDTEKLEVMNDATEELQAEGKNMVEFSHGKPHLHKMDKSTQKVENRSNCCDKDVDGTRVLQCLGCNYEKLICEVELISGQRVGPQSSAVSANLERSLSISDVQVVDKENKKYLSEEVVRKEKGTLADDKAEHVVLGASETVKRVIGEHEPQVLLSAEEGKRLEKIQHISVKFLRLVQRLGLSTEDSIVPQVLSRLFLVSGSNSTQAFSLESAERIVVEAEDSGKSPLKFSLNILVIGKTGVGKSSTINTLFGERKTSTNAFNPATSTVKKIVGKIDGIDVTVVDTPGFRTSHMDHPYNQKILLSIKRITKKLRPDVVLYVDRVDTADKNLNDLPLLRSITDSLGPSIWHNCIITLTHGASIPHDGPHGTPLSSQSFITQKSCTVQQLICIAASHRRMINPVFVVENQNLFDTNAMGEMLLPNGQSWRPHLLLLCFSVKFFSEAKFEKSPHLQHHKNAHSFLQSFALARIFANQNVKTFDSYDELGYSTDFDKDGGDKFDLLIPFKPLTELQNVKLTEEQERDCVESYDCCGKLDPKKQQRKNNPDCMYRVIKPSSQFLERTLLDAHELDHDVGFDVMRLEKTLSVRSGFPAVVCVQMTKHKRQFSIGSQFSLGKSCKMALNVGLDNRLNRQVSVRTTTSDHLQIAILVLLSFAKSFSSIFPQSSELS